MEIKKIDVMPQVPKAVLPTSRPTELNIKDTVTIGESGTSKLPAFPQVIDVKVAEGDEKRLKDGFDSSRDITGISIEEGNPLEPYRFKVKLAHIKPGAEYGNLDIYLLINLGKKEGKTELPDAIAGETNQPWNIAIGAYDKEHFKVYTDKGVAVPEALKELKFDTLKGEVSFALDKEFMRKEGWKDGEPVSLQVFTSKDFSLQVTDTLDKPAEKPWEKDGKLTSVINTASPSSYVPKIDGDWRDDIIYFVLTDRFEDGDVTNNMDVNKGDLRRYHGGDLQGIINKMDYLKDIGISTIWISPVIDNQTSFIESDGYHGYWPVDFFRVDEHLGDIEKLRELVDKAHKRGIKVILDMPLNHVAWAHPWTKDSSKYDWFHHIGDIKDWEDPVQVEQGSMYGLPDLAQENPAVARYLIDMCKWWIEKTGIDGFRLDAVRHIPKDFWEQFSKEIHKAAGPDFLLIGEDMYGVPGHLADYQNRGIDSLFDMPLYFTIRDVFARGDSMRKLASRLTEEAAVYDNPQKMSVIIDNHDTDRFLTVAGERGKEKLRTALAFIFTIDRIPTIYYGTEVAMEGHLEEMGKFPPENRKDMEWGKNPELLEYFKQLTNIRNTRPALQTGPMLEMWQDDQIFAYSRWDDDPKKETIVVLNNSSNSQYREIPVRAESNIPKIAELKDLLTGKKVKVENGKIKVHLNPYQPVILALENK